MMPRKCQSFTTGAESYQSNGRVKLTKKGALLSIAHLLKEKGGMDRQNVFKNEKKKRRFVNY